MRCLQPVDNERSVSCKVVASTSPELVDVGLCRRLWRQTTTTCWLGVGIEVPAVKMEKLKCCVRSRYRVDSTKKVSLEIFKFKFTLQMSSNEIASMKDSIAR